MSPEAYKANREKLGLSQAALAQRLGVGRETINRRESGAQKISEEAALAILQLLSSNGESEHTNKGS